MIKLSAKTQLSLSPLYHSLPLTSKPSADASHRIIPPQLTESLPERRSVDGCVTTPLQQTSSARGAAAPRSNMLHWSTRNYVDGRVRPASARVAAATSTLNCLESETTAANASLVPFPWQPFSAARNGSNGVG